MKQATSATQIMMLSVIAIVAIGASLSIGGTVVSAWTLLEAYTVVFGALTIGTLLADNSHNKESIKLLQQKSRHLSAIARSHNNRVAQLYLNFYDQLQHASSLSRAVTLRQMEALRKDCDQVYQDEHAAYLLERESYLYTWQQQHGQRPLRTYATWWKWLIATGTITIIALGLHHIAVALPDTPQSVPSPTQAEETTRWTAQTVPMPHLADHSRYVSNPDHVISDHTEQLLDHWFLQMDDSLGIESAVVVVNHIENEDIFRMAQDIFDLYHVGKDDRGLVIILAYGDHLFRTHTGRSLEADLTDAECFRLQERYLIPFMKAEQPDSGMLYLAEAIYNTLQKKELPSPADTSDREESDLSFILIYLLIISGWIGFALWLAHHYGRFITPFKSNPIPSSLNAYYNSGGGYFGGGGIGGGGGFSGGGGSFGGGFSGGSSGGGGATSHW